MAPLGRGGAEKDILFFAVGGGLMNGIGHVLLALMRGSYFPGLITAPLMLIVGVILLRKLYANGESTSTPA